MAAVVNVPGGPFAAGSTLIYTAKLLDENNNPISSTMLTGLTLSIVETLTGAIINGVSQVNILNTDRGSVDLLGNLTITTKPGDTAITEYAVRQVQRSLVIDWAYNGGSSFGGHQANFTLVMLAGP